jgi:hypothetical protein
MRGKFTQCPDCGYLKPDSGKPCPRCQAPEDTGSVRIIAGRQSVRWKSWAVIAAVPIGLFCFVGIWQAHDNALFRTLVLPASQEACGNLSGTADGLDRPDQSSCEEFAKSKYYTIKQDSGSHAFVTFREKGTLDSLQVSMTRDAIGNWHAVSAKEGINNDDN